MSPIAYFINDSRAVGVMLIVCTIISLILSNSAAFGNWYLHIFQTHIHYPSSIHLPHNYLEWINSFLMAFFFVMAGAEIKRELVEGELSSFKRAILPIGAAVGGMLMPALIFTVFNVESGFVRGWAIPTATDIAFALGVASLLGKRVPIGLKIFLMALAIIDDLGAIIVIALFYGGQIQWLYLGLGAGIYAVLMALNIFKFKFGTLQIILAFLLWYCIFNSGIEGSITGVLFAFSIPTKMLVPVEKVIHHFVNFIILPLFALANTAILIPSNFIGALKNDVALGIIFGLFVGKPVGIYLTSRVLVALKIAQLPTNVNWKQVFGMGMLAGIGFTMSIFTTMLAFSDEAIRDISKIAILTAVFFSVVCSVIYFVLTSKKVAVKRKKIEIETRSMEIRLAS